MKPLEIILYAGIAIIALEIFSGIAMITYGANYVHVDEDAANIMLVFISENNPEYYQRIQDTEEMSYRHDFYSHYTKYGDRKTLVAGIVMLIIAAGNALPVAALCLMRQQNEAVLEEKKNRIELKSDEDITPEESKDQPATAEKEVKKK